MPLPDAPFRLSLDAIAAAESAARRAGVPVRDWVERLILREAAPGDSRAASGSVGPEDEVRGGPEATEKPAHPTDD